MGARFSAPFQTVSGTHSLLFNAHRISFPAVKRPGRGVNHPPPSSAEVKESESNGFLDKSQHNLVLLSFIQADDMFRPLF